MTLKPPDYYRIGAIVVAVWLLALFRADQSRTNDYRPVGYRPQMTQSDDGRQAYSGNYSKPNSRRQQDRPGPASTVLAKSNFEKPVSTIAPNSVAVPKPVAMTAPVGMTDPVVVTEPFVMTEHKPVTIITQETATITEPAPATVSLMSEPIIATEPEPVVHTQNFVPIERPNKYALPAEVRSQVPPAAPLSSSQSHLQQSHPQQSNTENVDPAILKQQAQLDPPKQAENFGRVSYPNRVGNPRAVLLKNNHIDLSAPQTKSENSRLGDFQPPARDQGGDFQADELPAGDFSSNTTHPRGFQFAFEANHDQNERAIKPTLDPHVAQNSKTVRKVNWEAIEPDSNLATSRAPNHLTGLIRQASPPEVELRANGATNQGKALATRGAYFAAKEEFLNALMMIAESNDRVFANRAYTSSLTAGLTALKESEDFATTPRRRDHSRNLRLVLGSHETKIIDPDHVEGLSFSKASEMYCQFAQMQIEQAIGQSSAGSSALFYLSRLLSTAPELRGAPVVSGDNVKRAMLLASLTANPSNFEAANELGVLFYSEAWYRPAVHWFATALRSSGGNKLFWQNLAKSHARIAETTQDVQEKAEHARLAKLASQEIGLAPKLDGSSVSLAGWVSAEQFQTNSAIPASSFNQQAPVVTAQAQTAQQLQTQKRGLLNKRIRGWFE